MYFLNDLNFSRRDAGFKARKDALDIASDYENISVVNIPLWGGVVQRIISSVKLSTFLCGLENKDVLIFNFPMAKPFWHILSFFHRLLKFRIVPLIHDIDELRGGGGSDSVRLATCDMVISHNPQMTKYLSKYMSQDKIKDIKIFDYLVSSDVEHRDVTDKQRGVIYAGNLSRHKCSFIYTEGCDFTLFGVNYENKDNPKYLGSFDAQSPEKINLPGMQFGLIWDGDSVETCSGAFGDYLKFNNPHKTSLYLSMELPVFIWDKAALADFIVDNRIGYAVGSIKEMQEIVGSMTIETYKQISENTKIISQKIRTGSYFRDVLEEVIDDLKTR